MMKKLIMIALLVFSMFSLVAFSNVDTVETFDGNKVTTIEYGWYSEYTEATAEDQEIIMKELSELNFTPVDSSVDEPVSTTNNYSIKLTYESNDGCIIQFNFDEMYYSVQPFDSAGHIDHEQSKIYSANVDELEQIEKMFY